MRGGVADAVVDGGAETEVGRVAEGKAWKVTDERVLDMTSGECNQAANH